MECKEDKKYHLPDSTKRVIIRWMRQNDQVNMDGGSRKVKVQLVALWDSLGIDESVHNLKFVKMVKDKVQAFIRNTGRKFLQSEVYTEDKLTKIRTWQPWTANWMSDDWDGDTEPPQAVKDSAIDEPILHSVEQLLAVRGREPAVAFVEKFLNIVDRYLDRSMVDLVHKRYPPRGSPPESRQAHSTPLNSVECNDFVQNDVQKPSSLPRSISPGSPNAFRSLTLPATGEPGANGVSMANASTSVDFPRTTSPRLGSLPVESVRPFALFNQGGNDGDPVPRVRFLRSGRDDIYDVENIHDPGADRHTNDPGRKGGKRSRGDGLDAEKGFSHLKSQTKLRRTKRAKG
jgi:hypothetical protein